MYKVKNAIILAAGRGSRLKHLTKNIPKPLLAPKGISFIEGIIKKLKEKGINDIYVVVGYKGDKFNFLKNEVTIIENKDWNKGNNVTSIKAAIDILDNSLIINGDIIMKENVFNTEYESSLTYVERNSNIDEWIVEINEDGQVLNFDKNGLMKEGLYQREIIFINKELSIKIKEIIKDFNIEEYQEFLMLKTSLINKIPFKTLEVEKGTIFDLDTVDEFEEYCK